MRDLPTLERELLDARQEVRNLQVMAMRPNQSAEKLELLRNLEGSARAEVKLRLKAIREKPTVASRGKAEMTFEGGVAYLFCRKALKVKERRMISQRTRDALAALRAQGKKLGGIRPKTVKAVAAANARAESLRPVFTELSHLSARGIAKVLNERNVPTPRGKSWSAVTVIKVQHRLGLGGRT